ncbi:MAG: LysM peptidoglycan-binding domain-containing protein [Chitinophagales bacterium]
MQKTLITFFGCILMLAVEAQQKQQIVDYIERYKQIAIDEMVHSKIPASITLAQGILESAAGTSPLSKNSNNHFGIKCKEEWTGKKYYHDDDRPQECFRVYEHPEASYSDHSEFLLSRPRYAPLFELPITSYKYWAFGLKEAGYATNPKYAQILIGYIEDYKLYEYDQIGLALMDEKQKPEKQPVATEQLSAKAESKIIVTDVKHKETHPKQIVAEAKSAETGRKEYVVNGVRATKAEGNEDPFKIAYEYNIDYSFIMQFNDLTTGDRFKDGEYIYLQGKKARGADATYTVRAGESMHDISQKTGVKLKELYLKNAMKRNDQAYAGETLNLQTTRHEPPRYMSYAEYLKEQNKGSEITYSEKQSPDNNTATIKNHDASLPRRDIVINASEYRVERSDTLYSIAKKFNTSVEQLKEINNLDTGDLKAGQTLLVAK